MLIIYHHSFPEKHVDEPFVVQVSFHNFPYVPQFKVFLPRAFPISRIRYVIRCLWKNTGVPTKLECFWYFAYSLSAKTVRLETCTDSPFNGHKVSSALCHPLPGCFTDKEGELKKKGKHTPKCNDFFLGLLTSVGQNSGSTLQNSFNTMRIPAGGGGIGVWKGDNSWPSYLGPQKFSFSS